MPSATFYGVSSGTLSPGTYTLFPGTYYASPRGFCSLTGKNLYKGKKKDYSPYVRVKKITPPLSDGGRRPLPDAGERSEPIAAAGRFSSKAELRPARPGAKAELSVGEFQVESGAETGVPKKKGKACQHLFAGRLCPTFIFFTFIFFTAKGEIIFLISPPFFLSLSEVEFPRKVHRCFFIFKGGIIFLISLPVFI